ncbi:MAG: [FeFe] hydrogenase H-cluster maturation GTPase HydF [Bacteroidales bacterium]|jgi:[FeFe] hydrogenase H-cluster maturation GTPase HydF|nr:[FeFe] hydrogenase H-cluster maturation GTPase HydF [Bacteroidales bacterium]
MITNRTYVGIFGRGNTGKSSLINAIAQQDIAIVSDIAGTTTDPVKKRIEVLGIGPVVFVDTAGLDDAGLLGSKRIQKAQEVLRTIDVAIVLFSENTWGELEDNLMAQIADMDLPVLILHNKVDLAVLSDSLRRELGRYDVPILEVSAESAYGIEELTNLLLEIIPNSANTKKTFIGDIISRGDMIVLVMPQDAEAPEGRLILPQVQLIRDILDHDAIAVGLQFGELSGFLEKQSPNLVITDSQVFDSVARIVPSSIPLTSFSIILARSKGYFEHFLEGAFHLSILKDDDTVLILESCTHTVSCEDIGRYKIPDFVRVATGKRLCFEFVAGLSPILDPKKYAMAIQCGGCMVTDKQLQNRVQNLIDCHIPITNYGMVIAYANGILDRVTRIFKK